MSNNNLPVDLFDLLDVENTVPSNSNSTSTFTSVVKKECCPESLPSTLVDADSKCYSKKDHKKSADGKSWFAYYKCKHARTFKCTRTLKLTLNLQTNEVLKNYDSGNGVHYCQVRDQIEANVPLNLHEDMKIKVHEEALKEGNLSALEIAKHVLNFFQAKYSGRLILLLTLDQMISQVYRVRSLEYGSWEGQIKSKPLMYANDNDTRLFLQFDLELNLDNLGLQRIIGWAHPDLVFLLKNGPVNTFIDCTFRVVPKGFTQLMIIMVYSKAHEHYVPVFYILLQSKLEKAYYHAIQQAICASDWLFEASSVTCDFEHALINAIDSQFPKSTKVQCYFHWKQAIRRKLLTDYRIPS